MNFAEILQKFKFTEHEIAIFEHILRNDQIPLSIKEIANALKMTPSTVYRIITRFMECKFCEEIKIYGVRCYKGSINEQMKPFFLLNNKTILPDIEFFFGVDNIKKLYEETITNQPNFAYANMDNLNQDLVDFVMNEYTPNRAKLKTKAYVIASPFGCAQNYLKEGEKYLRYTKICNKFFDYGEINIYGDYIAILGARPSQPLGMRIQNPFLAHSMKFMFDLNWNLI